MNLRLHGCAVGIAIAMFAACKSTNENPDTGTGVSAIQFQDIVVPSGLTLQERLHESHSVEEGSWRHGHFEYLGSTKLEEASAHVLQRMPQHSWSLVTDEKPDQVSRKLKFVRGRYVATYTIRMEDTGFTRMVIDYRTEVTPR
jgi:hypothetical protein